ncbi:MAG: histidinol-phosphate transaminase [Candidatus Leucobacter sulfamidivorax]|nr:histidinol-phosphate transaminase [Candidatus Leucobacter sulfamidivorax]
MVKQRESIERLPAYVQGKSIAGAVKLSSNENPYPPLESVARVVRDQVETMQLYPDMSAQALRSVIAERQGVRIEEIAVGAGSVEVAGQLISASAGDGDEVVFAWRSFEAYPILVQIAGAVPVAVPLTADDRHDLPAMAAAVTERTRLILVCNPNNPTGAGVTTAELDEFMRAVPEDVLVVVDEAYVHFNDDPESADGLDFFRRYENVAVLHTFSKAYGLAGLRVGYAIARERVAENLRRVALPFGVTALAQHAAIASLAAEEELNERVRILVAERARLLGELRAAGWNVQDSLGNFVWLRTAERTPDVDAALRAQAIVARAYATDGIRVTVGSPAMNDSFLAAIRTIDPA